MKTYFYLSALLLLLLPGLVIAQQDIFYSRGYNCLNANHLSEGLGINSGFYYTNRSESAVTLYLPTDHRQLSYLSLPPRYYPFTPNDISKEQPVNSRPPLKAGRILAEYAMGVVGACVGTIASVPFYLHMNIEDLGVPYLLLANISLGSAAAVYSTGNCEGQTGSFWASLLGSAAGMVAAVYMVTNNNNNGYYLWLAPPLGATIGFTLTRQYKTTDAEKKKKGDFID